MDTTKQTSYIIYRTTCLLNNKIYIGKHKTSDLEDSYLGSGKMLRRAIKKHGIENFKKEILFVFDSEEEMNAKEAELVTEEFCSRDDTYNLCPGGKGGWGYVNGEDNLRIEKNRKAAATTNRKDLEIRKSWGRKGIQSMIEKYGKTFSNSNPPSFLGKRHRAESIDKMRLAASKRTSFKNSQFGSMWITDGIKNKKIKSVDNVPDGWYKGRTMTIKVKNELVQVA